MRDVFVNRLGEVRAKRAREGCATGALELVVAVRWIESVSFVETRSALVARHDIANNAPILLELRKLFQEETAPIAQLRHC